MRPVISSYYVRIRPQLNGFNAVHREDCPFLPDHENRICLGKYTSFIDALKKAELYFTKTTGCKFCTCERHGKNRKIIPGRLRIHERLTFLDLTDKN